MKLTQTELKDLRDAHKAHQRNQAKTEVTRAQLDFAVVDMFERHDMVQGKHSICLHCGNFFVRNEGCSCGLLAPRPAADG